jgi:hypothetical protein
VGGPPAWGLGGRLTTPHRKNSNLLRNTSQKPEGKRPLVRPSRRWEYGIKTDLRELGGGGGGGVVWIHLVRDRDRLRAVVSAVMNLRVLAPRNWLGIVIRSLMILR